MDQARNAGVSNAVRPRELNGAANIANANTLAKKEDDAWERMTLVGTVTNDLKCMLGQLLKVCVCVCVCVCGCVYYSVYLLRQYRSTNADTWQHSQGHCSDARAANLATTQTSGVAPDAVFKLYRYEH